jgi:hypothetical protein
MDTPNLDCFIDPDDLAEHERVFDLLRAYCFHKRIAMRNRLEGHIGCALVSERACDSIYKQLPDWARW